MTDEIFYQGRSSFISNSKLPKHLPSIQFLLSLGGDGSSTLACELAAGTPHIWGQTMTLIFVHYSDKPAVMIVPSCGVQKMRILPIKWDTSYSFPSETVLQAPIGT